MKKTSINNGWYFIRLIGLCVLVLAIVVWLGYSMPSKISLKLHPFGPKLLLLTLFVLPLSLIMTQRYQASWLWFKRKHFFEPITSIFLMCLIAATLGMLPIFILWGGAGVIDPNYSANYHVMDGHVPWSDAAGYLISAHNLIFDGELCSGCYRRPISGAFLAAKLAATGFNFNNAMLLQGVIFGLACFFCAASVARSSGVAAGIATFAIVFSYGAYFLPTNMSETLGLTMGAVAFAALWTGVNDNRFYIYTLGLWLFCLSQIVRPGAVLIIPALIIVGMLQFSDKRALFKLLVMVLLAILPGLFLDKLILFFYGDPSARSTVGNFSYILYGISVGNKGWHQVFVDYPAINNMSFAVAESFIYGKAIQNITAHPLMLMHGLGEIFEQATVNFLPDFKDHVIGGIGKQPLYLMLILPVYVRLSGCDNLNREGCALAPKSSNKFFFVAVFVGFLLSLAFIYRDGGIRSIATGVPFVATVIAIGLFPRAIYNFGVLENRSGNSESRQTYHVWGSGILGGLIVLSALIGPAVAHMVVATPPKVNITCAEGGQKKVMALLAIAYTDVLERESGHRVHESNEYSTLWNNVAIPASIFIAYDAITRTSFFGYGPPRLVEGRGAYMSVCASPVAQSGGGLWKIQSVELAK